MPIAPEAVLAGKKLVFIVGSGRSGTNWLRRLLSQSPNVATGPETHLFSSYLRSAAESWRHFDGSKVGLAHLISEEEMLAWMRDFADMCLGRIAEKRPNARIVLEKTPNHGGRGAEILQLFPDCYFIHIIRDPARRRDVPAGGVEVMGFFLGAGAASRTPAGCGRNT